MRKFHLAVLAFITPFAIGFPELMLALDPWSSDDELSRPMRLVFVAVPLATGWLIGEVYHRLKSRSARIRREP